MDVAGLKLYKRLGKARSIEAPQEMFVCCPDCTCYLLALSFCSVADTLLQVTAMHTTARALSNIQKDEWYPMLRYGFIKQPSPGIYCHSPHAYHAFYGIEKHPPLMSSQS